MSCRQHPSSSRAERHLLDHHYLSLRQHRLPLALHFRFKLNLAATQPEPLQDSKGRHHAGGRRCVARLVMRGDGDYQLLWRRSGAKGSGGAGRGGEARVSRGVVETSPLPRQGFPAAPSLTPGGASLQPLRGPPPPLNPRAPPRTFARRSPRRRSVVMEYKW